MKRAIEVLEHNIADTAINIDEVDVIPFIEEICNKPFSFELNGVVDPRKEDADRKSNA